MTARTSEGCKDGNAFTTSSTEAPSARVANTVRKVTLVPLTTGCPPQTFGSRAITFSGASVAGMKPTYHVRETPANRIPPSASCRLVRVICLLTAESSRQVAAATNCHLPTLPSSRTCWPHAVCLGAISGSLRSALFPNSTALKNSSRTNSPWLPRWAIRIRPPLQSASSRVPVCRLVFATIAESSFSAW